MVDPDPAVRIRAMEEAPIGIVVTDPDREDNPIVYANDAFLELTGYDREAVLGRNCRFLQGPDTAERPVARMREAIDAAEPVTVDIRNYRADGTLFWNRVSIAPVHDESGAVTNFIGSQRDVTEQKRRARQLEAIRDRMEFALDATDAYIYEIDIETGEETRHGPFERLHGLASAEIQTTEAFNERAVHPEDRDKLIGVQRQVTDKKPVEPVATEYRTNPAHGDVRWIYSEAYVQTGEGEPDTFVGLATDVTERKRRERELARQNERLDQFASVVSHDLKNPLNVAMGRLEIVRDEHDSDHLAAVDRALDDMEALIEDLLTLARQGDRAPDPVPVDLAAVVGDCWETVSTDGATLAVAAECSFRADRGLLHQLFENLFQNAIEHGGSDVSVEVGRLAASAGFYVADDGPGIPTEKRERVFEAGHSTRTGGTGFGLTIVQEVVEAHGWSVRVTDSESGGARFEFAGVETVA